MHLVHVERMTENDPEFFKANYLNNSTPVILENLLNEWPAKYFFNQEYLLKKFGHLKVPCFHAESHSSTSPHWSAKTYILFKEYLNQLDSDEPFLYRIFFYNIYKQAKELSISRRNFKLMEGLRMYSNSLFFGGKGSSIAMHYDIDQNHTFITQLHGKKKVILFPPSESNYIYRLPFTVSTMINFQEIDTFQFPALSYAKGFEVMLYPGETLFIPSGYWQFLKEESGSFHLRLKVNESLGKRLKGIKDLTVHYIIDKGIQKILGEKWIKLKTKRAIKKAKFAIQKREKL